jgi:membrane peptidoglycan carboxypeptidase
VTPAQAAALIAIVQDPSARSLGNKDNYKANQIRRDFILGRMYAAGDITKAQYTEAKATPVDAKFLNPSVPQSGCLAAAVAYRWICDYTVNDVDNLTQLGTTKAAREKAWATGGYDVYTTFDTALQDAATSILASLVPTGIVLQDLHAHRLADAGSQADGHVQRERAIDADVCVHRVWPETRGRALQVQER